MLDLTDNFDAVWPAVAREVDRRTRFAAALALTRTVQAAQSALQDEMRRVFDRPTPYTLQGVAITPATKQTLRAAVYIKPRQAAYLHPEVEGGERTQKRFEQKFAGLLGSSVALPGVGASLDQYGNLSKAAILKIAQELSQGKSGRYFAGQPRGHANLPEGIYMRASGNKRLVPIMVFKPAASYAPRFRFSLVARDVAESAFAGALLGAWSASA